MPSEPNPGAALAQSTTEVLIDSCEICKLPGAHRDNSRQPARPKEGDY